MSELWYRLDEAGPDWGEVGPVECRRRDGSIVLGYLAVDDYGIVGEDEYPAFTFTRVDGRTEDFYSFEEWRSAR